MPNRILREGILSSARVDALSVAAELFYRRLHSKVDDYGRHESHPELLRTACYPLRVDKVKARHVVAWLAECEKSGLLVTYKVGSKTYLQLLDWRQQMRSPSRCPAPDEQLIRKCLADAHLVVGVVVGVSEDEGVDEIASSAKAPSAAVNGNAVAYIPLNDGAEWGVSKDFVAELEKLFPAVNVPQTLNEIRAWNMANPQRRKTARGIKHHVTQWMAREQNRGPKN